MHLIKYFIFALLLIGSVSCGKLKFVAIKRPHFAFVGLKVKKPKLFGLKHGFGGGGIGGFGGGGFGGGGFHSSGYEHHEHHEYHESHHSRGEFGGFGGSGGWIGK